MVLLKMPIVQFAKIIRVRVGFSGSGKPEPSLMEKACAAFLILMQENLHIKMCDNLVVPPVLNLFRNKEESFKALDAFYFFMYPSITNIFWQKLNKLTHFDVDIVRYVWRLLELFRAYSKTLSWVCK